MILLHPLMLAGVTHMQEQIASTLRCLQADNTENENNLLLFPRGIIQALSLSGQCIHFLSVELWIDWILTHAFAALREVHRASSQAAMISQKEKRLLAEVWKSLIPAAEDIGSDTLLR